MSGRGLHRRPTVALAYRASTLNYLYYCAVKGSTTDFASAPRERDRDADYIVAFQASAWLLQRVGNIHHVNGNEPTHSDLGKGNVLRLCGCPCAMLSIVAKVLAIL